LDHKHHPSGAGSDGAGLACRSLDGAAQLSVRLCSPGPKHATSTTAWVRHSSGFDRRDRIL
jgi:hypothetical protein